MEKMIQGQKDWNEFSTNNNVGVVATHFSEQLLSQAFNTFNISEENFEAEISLYGLDTIFVDNYIYEADHQWYKKARGHLVNYCKNNDINLVVIKNTTNVVNQTFKKAFIMEIDPNIEKYEYDGMVLKVPMLLDTTLFNPIDSKKTRDITYYSVGKMVSSTETQAYNTKFKPKTRIVSEPRFTRHSLKKLSSYIKKTKILYFSSTVVLDKITMQYIENMALLNSTHVIYDHTIDVQSKYGFQSGSDQTNFNKVRVLLRNSEYSFKTVLSAQRQVFLNHSFLFMPNLKEFLVDNRNERTVPEVSIVTSTNRKNKLDFYINQMSNQKYVNIEINLVTHGYELSGIEQSKLRNDSKFDINIQSANSMENLGQCLNKAIDTSTLPVVAKIDDDDYYLEHYIIDQWIALMYSGAEVVGKSEAFYYFESENIIAKRKVGEYLKYDTFVMGATIMSKADTMKHLKFADLPKAVDTNYLRRVIANGGEIYIGHPYEMCVFRSGDDSHHTWNVSELSMLRNAEIVGFGSPEAHVTVD